ncbi:unnamed protein product [Nezara viridula]|uniref:Uncharacterized protein n=1 Tax=Nezara viridula TaxID=85310 RepID=A0A9P0HST7_NEZVI|nr:unnamed protein product [Nezara viridula]
MVALLGGPLNYLGPAIFNALSDEGALGSRILNSLRVAPFDQHLSTEDGRHLEDPTATLGSLNIYPDSVLILKVSFFFTASVFSLADEDMNGRPVTWPLNGRSSRPVLSPWLRLALVLSRHRVDPDWRHPSNLPKRGDSFDTRGAGVTEYPRVTAAARAGLGHSISSADFTVFSFNGGSFSSM